MGRTIHVRNEFTGEVETFRGVKVSDQAIDSWLQDRWLTVAAGYPNRPPDWESRTTHGWSHRPGEQPPTRSVLFDDTSALVSFRQSKPFVVTVTMTAVGDQLRHVQLLPMFAAPYPRREPGTVLAIVRGGIERLNDSFRARAQLIVELSGTPRREEAEFTTEAAARRWLDDMFHSMAGTDVAVDDIQLNLGAFSDAAA